MAERRVGVRVLEGHVLLHAAAADVPGIAGLRTAVPPVPALDRPDKQVVALPDHPHGHGIAQRSVGPRGLQLQLVNAEFRNQTVICPTKT